MSVGPLEIVIVLVLALLIFGPKQLPQAGRSLGQAMREFRKATQTARTELGLDDVVDGINDVKSSVSLSIKDSGVTDVMNDIKSSTTIDLKATGKATAVAGAATVATAAPPADKPVPVVAEGSDTTPVETAAAEPVAADAEPVAADAAADDTVASGTSAGRDDA